MLGMKEIMAQLPHRFGFLMPDRIEEAVEYERAVGYKNVTANEFWTDGHFPGEPVFPGVLMIETMAQIGAFIFPRGQGEGAPSRRYLSGVDKVKFLRLVIPGDTIRVEAKLVARVGHLAKVECEARVNGELAATGVISYAIAP
ncbi:MAG TPA: 3-hydroxyacyl-ACP dehydratase FabZ [Symbiobacteriaceae bacterium]|nr:3-hydroxyacyl-ACP dehydratase FabZ [Symbiobacteriaceae bacterium]